MGSVRVGFPAGNIRKKFLKYILSRVAFVVNVPGRAINLQLVLGYTRVVDDLKQGDKKYSPSLHLSNFASNLYNDVGELAMTLINLRIKQAEVAIQKILDRE